MTIRTRWTDEEREQVLEKATILYHTKGIAAYEAIREAQALVLPLGRQRPFKTHSACLDLIKEVKVRTPAFIKKPEPAAKPVEPPKGFNFDELVKALAIQIAEAVKVEVRAAVIELEKEFAVKKHNPEYATTGTARPRIIIIGLLGDQVHNIDHEFGSVFDLKFIDTDRANALQPPDADAYLLMKNFINHPLYHKYRGFSNHVLIDGGMTALRTWLHAKANFIIANANQMRAKH